MKTDNGTASTSETLQLRCKSEYFTGHHKFIHERPLLKKELDPEKYSREMTKEMNQKQLC